MRKLKFFRTFPNIPYRQWKFTVPRKLRYIMAYDHPQRALLSLIRNSIKDYINSISKIDIEIGSVCFIQRFGSGLNLNIHFHLLISEGGYFQNNRKRAKFHKIRPS